MLSAFNIHIMSRKTLCRLCVSISEEYKSLYDESGQGNNVYEITLKYFDPMLLAPASEWDSKVICLKCWHYINDFHGFQQTILQTQSNLQTVLQAEVKENEAGVKLEDILLVGPLPVKEEDALNNAEISYNANAENNMSNIESHDVEDDNPDSTSDEDDMKPLIFHVTKSQKRKRDSNKPNEEDSENIINAPTNRKVRRLSTSMKRQKSAKAPKPKRKLKIRESVSDIPKSKGVNRQSPEEQNANEVGDSNADNSNSDKKSYNDKTLEWDNFIAQWKQELECIHCATTVEDFALLRKHFRSHHPNEKFYAKCCDRRFTKRFTLFEHIQLHLDPKVFECNVCGKCSTSSSNLSKHKKELHTEEGKLRPFECSICQKNFTSKTNLRIHMEVHESSRDHICSECGKGFPSEQRRKIHERMVHNVDRICDQCGRSVHGIYALKQHLLEHKGVEKTKWPCDICGAQLNSHSSRKRHKQLKHNDGTTAYICSDCGKVYTSEPALLGHKRMAHTRELKFKCNYCEKAFKTPRNLREHTATHTGIDIYQCPHCPKTFKMSSNMHHHRKKVHPMEWAEGRINKRTNKINLSLVSNEVVI